MFDVLQSLVNFDGSIGSLVVPMIVILFAIAAFAIMQASRR